MMSILFYFQDSITEALEPVQNELKDLNEVEKNFSGIQVIHFHSWCNYFSSFKLDLSYVFFLLQMYILKVI